MCIMKANFEVVFKSVEKREAGSFVNDKGEEIKYDSSYVLKFDEIVDGIINQRTLKFPTVNEVLYSKLSNLKPYDKIVLEVEVLLFDRGARVVPVDVIV